MTLEASESRARGRWKILRNALLTKSQNDDSSAQHNIHRFQGYNLLPAKQLSTETRKDLDEKLRRIHATDSDTVLEQLEQALLIRLSLLEPMDGSDDKNGSCLCFDFIIEYSQDNFGNSLDLLPLTSHFRTHHSIEAICEWIGNGAEDRSGTLQIHIQRPNLSHSLSNYSIMEYPLVNTSKSLWIRQRQQHAAAKLTLSELASHQFHQGVDNTGNVCIWDAEKTLAWAMLQEYQNGSRLGNVKTLTELGVGMAGLAAMACATLSPDLERVTLTDGHMDCVRNNQLNVRLLESLAECATRIDCRQLLWTVDNDSEWPEPADWTLVSDCTHFQEYHAALFWTLVQCTKVGGTIWMCQPNRGHSWRRFCDLVVYVNYCKPLLSLPSEQSYPELDCMHECFLRQPDSHYNPDIHQPCVFCLTKLRDATEQDRQRAIRHIETRDN